MDLKEIFEIVLAESGEFLLTPTHIELDMDPFRRMVKRALGVYNKFCPIDAKFSIDFVSRSHAFTESSDPYGIPDNIITAFPVNISGAVPYTYLKEFSTSNNPELQVKQQVPIVYRSPVLTVPFSGFFEVHALYYHKVVERTVDGEPHYFIDTISENTASGFFDLVKAKFLLGLARSRRAFTLNDLPIISDASELASEGKELERETITETLAESEHKFYLGWG